MTKPDKAAETFNSGFNCAQSVLIQFCEEYGLDSTTALKLATSFGGGMAHNAQTCGAVTGAIMAIGLKYGRTRVEDIEIKDKNYELVGKFMTEFKKSFGSLSCPELLGIDLSTPEGFAIQKEKGMTRQVCPKFVSGAARILEEIISEKK